MIYFRLFEKSVGGLFNLKSQSFDRVDSHTIGKDNFKGKVTRREEFISDVNSSLYQSQLRQYASWPHFNNESVPCRLKNKKEKKK